MSLQKKKPFRSKEYLAFVRTLPCCVPDSNCMPRETVMYHHTTRKGPDDETIPLCYYHHIMGVHWLGRETFEEKHGITIADMIRQTQRQWRER